MKQLFLQIFTWWNGQTLGMRWFTFRKGVRVGEDQEGNIYYRESKGPRRWVIYNGVADASRVPPEWHGWLHHTVDMLPADRSDQPRAWWKPHRPNMTGSAGAFRPKGSILMSGRRLKATGDYQAWQPEVEPVIPTDDRENGR